MSTRPRPGLKILLLEDDPLDAELVTHAVQRVDPGSVVQRVETQGTFKRALESFRPDVILCDSGLPGFSSLNALHLAQVHRLEAPFFLVAGVYEPSVAECLKAGATDFIPKTELSRLVPAITAALKQRASLRKLSQRQRQVLRLLATGASMQEIARQLDLSVKTVETHRAAVMKRLGVTRLTELVRYAIRVGIVSVSE